MRHGLGGAAGAMSRITGTLGKGVAALTLDDDYKRRRREEMVRAPDNFGAGMARGGKGLVMVNIFSTSIIFQCWLSLFTFSFMSIKHINSFLIMQKSTTTQAGNV